MQIEGLIRLLDLKPVDILTVQGSAERYVFLGMLEHPLHPKKEGEEPGPEGEYRMVIWWQWARGYVLDYYGTKQRLPFSKMFRYELASDTEAMLKLALNTWQDSGASLRPPVKI